MPTAIIHFILDDHYCVFHYTQLKLKLNTKITSCINKFNEQKDNIWLFIAMSFYDLFQGQCVQILMLSTIIAEHTKVCHLPGSKIACVNVHKLSSISEKNKIWLEKLHILSISKKLQWNSSNSNIIRLRHVLKILTQYYKSYCQFALQLRYSDLITTYMATDFS